MLSYALAIAVAISSLVLFSTAFLMSDIHRQDDFLWSGIGLFYALVLWFCARNITGAVLLGQAAAATLLVSYSWQTLKLRKAVAHPQRAVEINNFSVLQAVNSLLKRNQAQPAVVSSPQATSDKVTEQEIAIPDQASTEAKLSNSTSTALGSNKSKSGVFGKLFSRQKKSTITNTKLDDILEEKVVGQTNKTSTSVNQPVVAPVNTDAKAEPIRQVETAKSEVEKISVVQPTQLNAPVETKLNEVLSQPQATSVQPTEVMDTQKEDATSLETAEPPVAEKEPKTTPEAKPDTSSNQDQVATKLDNGSVVTEEEPATIAEVKPAIPTEASEVAQSSSLDSLETVEVAEVLDALPDDKSGNQDTDRSNIIEVTTTEISITTEVKEIEQNQDEKFDSN